MKPPRFVVYITCISPIVALMIHDIRVIDFCKTERNLYGLLVSKNSKFLRLTYLAFSDVSENGIG